MSAQAFLRDLAAFRPALRAACGELGELHERKLWHELTLKLEEVVAAPAFCGAGDDVLVQLYTRFVSDFEAKLNQLKLAHLAVAVSARLPASAAAVAFLTTAAAKLDGSGAEGDAPRLYLSSHVALLRLQAWRLDGRDEDMAAAKAGADAAKSALEALPPGGEDAASVHASVHFLCAQLAKARQEFAAFYKAGLMYLAYVALDALPDAIQLELAVDLSLAALLGDKIYSFGELLNHPVLKSLEGSGYEWLAQLLAAFNAGDLEKYEALCAQHAGVLNAQPALVAAERQLREKITILALIETVAALPSEKRTISLADIAAKTQLSLDGVEFLLMKTLSVRLIEGVIDQVAGTVRVTWVQPRVLLPSQIAAMRDRLDGWISKVTAARMELEAGDPGLIGMA